MKRARLVFMCASIAISCLYLSSRVLAQQPKSQDSGVTLYSTLKHAGEQRKFCFNFKIAPKAQVRRDCDVSYGMMYLGDDLDWFQSATAQDSRSVIKDLGEHDWSTWFEVPVVDPFPKLKSGEQRQITVDTSGADGAGGGPGTKPLPPRKDRKPRIDPIFAKALLGHVYVIHVVDETRDFYALFRVEALEKGDSCTFSWKLIPEPVNQTSNNTSR